MKRTFAVALSFLAVAAVHSQKIVKEHYTVSGGVLGAANLAEFRLSGNNPTDADYDTKVGWSAGVWLNLPVANWLSIEPQVMWSSLRYRTTEVTPLLLNDGKIRYVTVPVALKFHLGDKFALTAGPQVDFVTSVTDKTQTVSKEDFKKTS